MAVSSGLQKYFDAQQKKQSAQAIKKRFADLEGKVDPAFMQSFANFHGQIMDIIDEDPGASDIVLEEVDDLASEIENTQRTHNLKKAQSIIDVTE